MRPPNAQCRPLALTCPIEQVRFDSLLCVNMASTRVHGGLIDLAYRED